MPRFTQKEERALFHEKQTYKINQHRTVGTADDAKAGLLKAEHARLIDENPSATNLVFKRANSFKPTLVIYFIKPEDQNGASLRFRIAWYRW